MWRSYLKYGLAALKDKPVGRKRKRALQVVFGMPFFTKLT